MLFSILPLSMLALMASFASAAPTVSYNETLTNFFLVTTTDRHAARNSSHLTKVRATTLYDPKDQEQFLLRPIGPGYNSLAHFNISDGVLNSRSQGIEGYGEFVYNSTKIAAGGKLTFTPGMYPAGNLGLKNGYLLTVDGSAKGWQICPGPLGENVIHYQATSDKCKDTFIHAVSNKPY